MWESNLSEWQYHSILDFSHSYGNTTVIMIFLNLQIRYIVPTNMIILLYSSEYATNIAWITHYL